MRCRIFLHCAILFMALAAFSAYPLNVGRADNAPAPLLEKDHPVDWWFVFKFNSAVFPGCKANVERVCRFGGEVQDYPAYGQQFVFATSEQPSLSEGSGCAGDTTVEPIGATFDQVFNGSFFYVIWNDQFYDDPEIAGCTKSCSGPWGHSKGMLAWNIDGEGLVMQVTTPSWPAAGNKGHPRKNDGNTLGCVEDDNVKVSQHFFAVKLNKDDIVTVLMGLSNASVVTDTGNPQVVNNGGPQDIQDLVKKLGSKSTSTKLVKSSVLNGKIQLISKPSKMNVPPWQMVSATLGGASLRVATWWANPKIYTTKPTTEIACWDSSLGVPGLVEIATTGQWDRKRFGLTGGGGPNFNHAKIGVSTSGDQHYTILGDMNQQGTLSGDKCSSSQNGRGGLFFVLNDTDLFASVTKLISGDTAPDKAPAK